MSARSQHIRDFTKQVEAAGVHAMTGTLFSVLLALLAYLVGQRLGVWIFSISAIGCLLWGTFKAWDTQRDRTETAEARIREVLTPRLRIESDGAPMKEDNKRYHRLRVTNDSDATVEDVLVEVAVVTPIPRELEQRLPFALIAMSRPDVEPGAPMPLHPHRPQSFDFVIHSIGDPTIWFVQPLYMHLDSHVPLIPYLVHVRASGRNTSAEKRFWINADRSTHGITVTPEEC